MSKSNFKTSGKSKVAPVLKQRSTKSHKERWRQVWEESPLLGVGNQT